MAKSETNPADLLGHGLADKAALVTGGTSGIGRAAARLLAAAGCRVAVNYAHNDGRAEEALAEVAPHGEAALFKADVADPDAARGLVADVAARFGGLGVLVHSAGVPKGDDADPAQFDRVVRSHLHSTHYLLPAAAKAMAAGKPAGGSIVVVTSIAANKGGPTSYAAAMAAKRCYALGFARQVAADGVRVNCVAPGTIFTDMLAPFFKSDAARRERAQADMPLWKRREGYPVGDDVAKVIAFLAGDLSGHITGEEIKANGGQWVSC